MIAIEPAPSKFFVGATLRKRELSQFLSCASKAIGLSGEVSVLLTGDERTRLLNYEFRGIDKATDVLSFPAADQFALQGQIGDLAISLETAQRQAAQHGHSLETEIKILMLHGLLHLSGLDHETDRGQMARKELALRTALDLPAGLVERASRSTKMGKAAAKKRARASKARLGKSKTKRGIPKTKQTIRAERRSRS